MSDLLRPPSSGSEFQVPQASAVAGGRDDFVYIESKAGESERFSQLRELFSWRGRYSRDRFWVVYIGAVVVAMVAPAVLWSLLVMPLMLALTWIMIGAIVKRFHDRNKSGWWALVSAIPLVGTVWILVECGLLEGDSQVNAYGARARTLRDMYAKDESGG